MCFSFAEAFQDLAQLALQALQLRRDDQHVGEQCNEYDEIRRRGVLLTGRHVANSSRSSRRRRSRRFPASSSWYSVPRSATIASSATQKVKNCAPVICGP